MLRSRSSKNRMAFDAINLVAGLSLVLSPWIFGFLAETYAAWNAWLVGGIVAVIAVSALVAYHEAEEWIILALGIWAMVAPWMLDFAGMSAAVAIHVIAGLVIAMLAASCIWFTNNRPLYTA